MIYYQFTDPIEKLSMTTRLRNCLHRARIHTVGALLDHADDTWQNVPNMGSKSIEEVHAVIADLRNQIGICPPEDSEPNPSPELEAFQHSLSIAYGLPDITSLLRQILSSHPDDTPENLLCMIYREKVVHDAFSHRVLTLLNSKYEGMPLALLRKSLPSHLSNLPILEELLSELQKTGEIQKSEGLYQKIYPSAIDYVLQYPDEEKRNILCERLAGKTLKEIGNAHGFTRERTRQICNKFFTNHPHFSEDRYQSVFCEYLWNAESFTTIFHETKEVYHYLETVCDIRESERKPLEQILEDSSIPTVIMRSAESYIYRNYLTIGGTRIAKKRPDLLHYVVKTQCRNKTTYSDLLLLYRRFLEEHGLADVEKIQIASRSYENKLATCDYTLWNQNHSFRYYNIEEMDFTRLISEINLSQYDNQEFSTLKIFRIHPELMEEYDIRDEFELHNLLKKIWKQHGNCDVTFSKMPTLRMGQCNTDKQVRNLLLQCAPISQEDFAQEYENQYGVKAATAKGNCFHCIDPYLIGDVYTINQESLPTYQHNRMREILTRDFYDLADIQRLYEREYPSETRKLNSYNLKMLGFNIYSNYAVSTQFSSAAVYFRHILTCEDVVNVTDFPLSMTQLPAFQSELAALKASRTIIECSHKFFINIRRLEQKNITREILEDYCQKVNRFVEPGTYFTISSLRREGFVHELDDLYFDECFYSSILAEDHDHFSYRRMGGNRLFFKGNQKVQLCAFLQWILEKQERVDLDDLVELLSEQYQLNIRRDKLLWVLKDTSLYYDRIMDRVYIDYDTYFEEV